MMEFVTSRAALVICGTLLIASVAAPMEDLYGNQEKERMEGVADSVAEVFSTFWGSSMDEMYLRCREILPQPSAYITAEGHFIILHTDGGDYARAVPCEMEEMVLRYDSEVTLIRTDSGIIFRRRSRISFRGRRRNGQCPRGCCRGRPRPSRSRVSLWNRNRSGRSASRSGS